MVTSQPDYVVEGALIARDFGLALALASPAEEAFVIGGAKLYEQSVERVDRIYMTMVDAEIEGDTFFPPLDLSQWQLVQDEAHPADERNDHPFRLQSYRRSV